MSVGEKRRKVKLSTVERLASGATAGAVGKSAVAPFQRIQILYQVNVGQKLTLAGGLATTKDVIKNEGISALWRGNIANAGRSAPTAAIKFWSQSLYSAKIKQMNWSNGVAQFVGGSLSGVTTVSATYPLDLFRYVLFVCLFVCLFILYLYFIHLYLYLIVFDLIIIEQN